MDRIDPPLQPFLERLRELQFQEQQATDVLGSQPDQAFALFHDLQGKADELYRDWETWLHQNIFYRAQEAQLRQQAIETRAFLLSGQGQAASLLGSLHEAQSACEQGLALLGEQPSFAKMALLMTLGSIHVQQAQFPEAAQYYQRAFDESTTLGQHVFHDDTATKLWKMAVMARSSMADCALYQGDRVAFLRALDEAMQLAETHHLLSLKQQLQLKSLTFRLAWDTTGELLQKLENPEYFQSFTGDTSFQVDMKCLLAVRSSELGGFQAAKRHLEEALKLAQALPVKQWGVLLELARYYEARGHIQEAIEQAEQALEIARKLHVREMIQQTLLSLVPLRYATRDAAQREQAERELQELRSMGRSPSVALALLARALVFYQERQFASALADIDEAEQSASTLELRRQVFVARAATLDSAGRLEEALQANVRAIELYQQQLVPADEPSWTRWRDMLSAIEALYSNAASLTARLGNVRQAFEWAEQGKAQLLARQLALAGQRKNGMLEQLSQITFDELREILAAESAAMAMFWVASQSTLVLVLDPHEQEPYYRRVDLGSDRLRSMLSTGQESDSWGGILTHELWGDILTHALPQLEQLLLSPLREVVQHCRVLYLVPDSQLYFVPFAALTFADGTALIDHCALATVPSATILKWCRSRRPNQPRRDLLALGVGEASDKNTRTIAFAEYAQAIAQAINALGVTETKLLPETTTAKQLLAEARHCTILHLACHGTIDETNLDMLAASSLMLADQLTARDVFNTQLSTELVFLNACMSGGFRLRISGEVGGFWQAFLHAGTASLIATLFYVHPDSAQQLALAFYKEWLKGGVTKAEALRRAQRQLRQQCAELSWWASHILIGDHR